MSTASDTPKLSSAILELQNMARAFDIVASDTIHQRGNILVDKVRERCPEVAGYTVIVMTEDEAEAASFLALEMVYLAKKVARLYGEATGEEVSS